MGRGAEPEQPWAVGHQTGAVAPGVGVAGTWDTKATRLTIGLEDPRRRMGAALPSQAAPTEVGAPANPALSTTPAVHSLARGGGAGGRDPLAHSHRRRRREGGDPCRTRAHPTTPQSWRAGPAGEQAYLRCWIHQGQHPDCGPCPAWGEDCIVSTQSPAHPPQSDFHSREATLITANNAKVIPKCKPVNCPACSGWGFQGQKQPHLPGG